MDSDNAANRRGYEYEMNVLLECPEFGMEIQEVEIETIYLEDNASSHFDTVKDSVRIYKEILKFSASSLISFAVDYGLFSLLTLLTAELGISSGLTVSNIGARIVSSSVNYTMNRNLVFRNKSSIRTSAAKYFALAGAILAGNTLVLRLLTGSAGMNPYAAKIFTEVLFFFVSWTVQRLFIFRSREEDREQQGGTRHGRKTYGSVKKDECSAKQQEFGRYQET